MDIKIEAKIALEILPKQIYLWRPLFEKRLKDDMLYESDTSLSLNPLKMKIYSEEISVPISEFKELKGIGEKRINKLIELQVERNRASIEMFSKNLDNISQIIEEASKGLHDGNIGDATALIKQAHEKFRKLKKMGLTKALEQ